MSRQNEICAPSIDVYKSTLESDPSSANSLEHHSESVTTMELSKDGLNIKKLAVDAAAGNLFVHIRMSTIVDLMTFFADF